LIPCPIFVLLSDSTSVGGTDKELTLERDCLVTARTCRITPLWAERFVKPVRDVLNKCDSALELPEATEDGRREPNCGTYGGDKRAGARWLWWDLRTSVGGPTTCEQIR
jgi:hypothetical protein